MIIYKATVPDGKCYIGRTIKSLDFQRKRYERNARNGVVHPFYQAVHKYGAAIKWEVIARANTTGELNALKERYIAKHGTITPNGYNERRVSKIVTPPEKIRAKISKKLSGRQLSEVHKARLSESQKARWARCEDRRLTAAHRAALSAAAKADWARRKAAK